MRALPGATPCEACEDDGHSLENGASLSSTIVRPACGPAVRSMMRTTDWPPGLVPASLTKGGVLLLSTQDFTLGARQGNWWKRTQTPA